MKDAGRQRSLLVEIANVRELVFSGPCMHLIAPAAFGEVCVLPRHAPLLVKLVPGELRFKTVSGEEDSLYTSGGFMEVQGDIVTVLADATVRAADLDREAALEAKRAAENALRQHPVYEEREAARTALEQALAQLRMLQHIEELSSIRRHARGRR